MLHHLCVKFQEIEEANVCLEASIEHHLFFLNADVVISACLRTNKTIPSIDSIEYHSFNRHLLHEPTLFFNLNLLLFLCLLLFLLLCEVSLGPDRSIKEIDMRENVIEHIREILDIILVSKALFGS